CSGNRRSVASFPTRRSSDLRRRTGEVDHHALYSEDDAVAGERVSPRFQLRRADLRAHEVHATHAAPVGAPELEAWRYPLPGDSRSEEHTSELQSRGHLVCRL